MIRNTKLALGVSTCLLSMGALAAPAVAAPNDTWQNGLVNVAISDTTVQVPVALAANICDTTVNVLATQLADGSAPCDAAADGTATRGDSGPNSTRQRGLVNIALTNTTIQVPIGVALNLCDTTVNALSLQVVDGAAECDAVADAGAQG